MSDRPTAPAPARLLELVGRLAGQKVLLMADLVADRFIRGTPKRISREAPVLILSVENEELVPGGGANAAANIATLGGSPLTLGVVGADAAGSGLIEALERRGVDTAGIVTLDGYRTPTKTRVLGGARHAIKQQIVRFDVEEELGARPALGGELERRLAGWHGLARVAVLSDYGYGAVTPERLRMVRSALAGDAVVLCDSRFRLGEFAGVDGATPNEEEAETLAGAPFDDDDGKVEAAGREMRERLGARFLLITRGSRGMSLIEPGGVTHLPVHGTDQVADVTGAGDTVIGTFALAIAAGASPLEAALLADYAGGVVVAKTGTATIAPAELRHAVESDPGMLEGLRWARS